MQKICENMYEIRPTKLVNTRWLANKTYTLSLAGFHRYFKSTYIESQNECSKKIIQTKLQKIWDCKYFIMVISLQNKGGERGKKGDFKGGGGRILERSVQPISSAYPVRLPISSPSPRVIVARTSRPHL